MEYLVDLGPDDAGEVLTLQRAAYVTEAQAHDDLSLPPLLQTLTELRAELEAPSVVALGWRHQEGRLLAAGRVHTAPGSTEAEIGRLTVVPDQQGAGLGSRLLVALEQRVPAEVRDLWLFTGERSHTNLRLYARNGYREARRESTSAGYALVWLTKAR